MPAASVLLKRPIKWIEDRRENFLATHQERDEYWDMEIAVDNDGRILGLRGRMVHDEGAYLPWGLTVPWIAATTVPGPYIIPSFKMDVIVVFTNKISTTPVRGAGRPSGVFVMERLMDRVARELKLDPAEVRRRNFVQPGMMPYKVGIVFRDGRPVTYDSGDYPTCQQKALDFVDYAGFPARQAEARFREKEDVLQQRLAATEQKLAELEQKGRHVTYIKGYVRPLALYKLLYETRSSKSVLVFDDSDSIFHDDVSMNLLKSACDSTDRRILHWLSRSIENESDEDGESIPDRFEFEGSVIFITNYDFDNMINSGSKLAPHFEALVSRSHYLDLAMKTKMDYLVRIKQVVRGGMLKSRGMNEIDTVLIMQFIENNVEVLRELSLRMVVKIAGLYKMNKSNWQKLAKQTCFRGV